jgi:hypothetical protein
MIATLDLDPPLKALGAELSAEIPRMIERGLARMREEAPDYFVRDDDAEFVDVYMQSYLHQLRFIVTGLASRRDLATCEPPAVAVEEARYTANLGIKLNTLLHTYRIGQRLIFEEVLEKSEQIRDDGVREAVLRAASGWLFAYVDWMSERVTDAYERERDLLVQDREQRKRQLVQRVLDGEAIDAGQLGYEIEREHLGVVAWGDKPGHALSALGDATGVNLLKVVGPDETGWAWLGARALGEGELHAIGAFEPPPGARLAFGTPGFGVEGFGVTHRQALTAQRLAGEARVTWHRDVALLALALEDPGLARHFVFRELGPLADTDERSRMLRETLAVYFRCGHNGASAAAALEIHDRTVLYRIRSIEERLGYPIADRREELGMALRLAPLVLGDTAG